MELLSKIFVFTLLILLSFVSMLLLQNEASKVMKFQILPQNRTNRTSMDGIFERIMRRSRNICKLSDRKSSKFNESVQKEVLEALMHAAKNPKVILTIYPDHDDRRLAKDLLQPWDCGRCVVTRNRSTINDHNTLAAVFLYSVANVEYLPSPKERRTDQLYVWQTGEAPPAIKIYRGLDLRSLSEFKFNATMSYRRNSDIYNPYHQNMKTLQPITDWSNFMTSKTRLAVALVSNCGPLPGARKRFQYLKTLLELGLDLDAFGKCFEDKLTIPKEKQTDFVEELKKYKFYFAFENSYHCRDYITEKLFRNGFHSGVVPVVWGGTKEDYEAVSPHHSIIHVNDFGSMRDLIDYLNYLDKNDEEYLKYLRWRTNPCDHANPEQKLGLCRLCRMINGINVDDVFHPEYENSSNKRPLIDKTMSKRVVPSIRDWFYGDENKDCF